MKNETLKLAKDETAENEPSIKPSDLLAELIPLLDHYFVGEITFDGENITYALLNGQKFTISATETT